MVSEERLEDKYLMGVLECNSRGGGGFRGDERKGRHWMAEKK